MFRNLSENKYKSLKEKKGKYVPTGIDKVDYALNDLAPALVTLLSGRSNEGKTTFVRQIIANAINHNNKCCVINGEGDEEIWINEFYKTVVGRNPEMYKRVKINKRYYKEPTEEVLKQLEEWHRDKLIINHADRVMSFNELFEELVKEIKQNKPDLIVIDNLMSLLNASSSEKLTKQAEFVQNCHLIAVKFNLHIVIVVHPNKEYRKGNKPDFENISGNSDIYNKADNILWVSRDWDNGGGKIYILKSRYFSEIHEVETAFDEETGLLCEIDNGIAKYYKFNLDNYVPYDENFKTPFDL